MLYEGYSTCGASLITCSVCFVWRLWKVLCNGDYVVPWKPAAAFNVRDEQRQVNYGTKFLFESFGLRRNEYRTIVWCCIARLYGTMVQYTWTFHDIFSVIEQYQCCGISTPPMTEWRERWVRLHLQSHDVQIVRPASSDYCGRLESNVGCNNQYTRGFCASREDCAVVRHALLVLCK